MDHISIIINLNIIVGDVNGSVVIQGSDGNSISIESVPHDLRELLQIGLENLCHM